ncbi:MAG: tripartite tricarboxylate transporter permease [Pirellulaceae bacterium]|jgi:putative tricarboxylic transport membrane protein
MNGDLLQALHQVFLDPTVWIIVICSACYGVFLGAMPGLTATMGVALFVPMTYWLEPVPALAAIVTMVACAIFAGDIPTTLVRIPGTPASAAYADDAYALAQRGQAELALGTSLWFSVSGGLLGAGVLMLLGHQLAKMAAWFSVTEYFWLYLMGLSCAVVVGRSGIARSLTGLAIGLLLSTVGLSAVHGQARFTFGHPELFQGINFIPAMIGLFGLSEVLRNVSNLDAIPTPAAAHLGRGILAPALRLFRSRPWAWLRSSAIGSIIGILPGAGADMAAWVCVAVSKKFSKQPSEYGQGSVHCIADATAGNSSSLAGAWIPALVFGIPGDSVTAMVIGVLYMKNLKPGPEIFELQGALVYSIYLIFILANLVLLPVAWCAIKASRQVMRIPRRVLLPVILLFCIVGAFAVNGSAFDVALMLAFGLVGVICERWSISIGALVLGLILGGPLEERFVQTLAGGRGDLTAFIDRPLAAVLAVACLVLWAGVALNAYRRFTRD